MPAITFPFTIGATTLDSPKQLPSMNDLPQISSQSSIRENWMILIEKQSLSEQRYGDEKDSSLSQSNNHHLVADLLHFKFDHNHNHNIF
jgi:hypothetical protein